MSKRRHESEKSRPLLRMFCVVSTPDAYLFGLNRTSDFTESDKDVKKTCATHAGRMHAFFCAFEGAPKFRMFCKTFAGFWNKICVISTPRGCFGRCQQLTPPESRKMCSCRKKSKNISCVFLLLFFYFFGKIYWNF